MTLAFMDQPSYRWASLTSKTFRHLAEETGLPVELLLGMEEALGARQWIQRLDHPASGQGGRRRNAARG
jgi:hypothetical protein